MGNWFVINVLLVMKDVISVTITSLLANVKNYYINNGVCVMCLLDCVNYDNGDFCSECVYHSLQI